MIIVVTGGVAAGKSTLLAGMAAALRRAGHKISEVSDRWEIHAEVIRDCGEVDGDGHGEVRRNRAGDIPGLDTRVGLFDAYHLTRAHDALIQRIHAHVRATRAGNVPDGVLLVEWATGPRVDFAARADWSGHEGHRWLDQALEDVLARLRGEGLLPRIHLAWVDRAAAVRTEDNAVRRDAVPDDDFSLLGAAGGGLHELSAAGLRLAASLAEGGRFAAVRNGGSREELVSRGEELGQGWAPPLRSLRDHSPVTDVQRGWIDAAREFVRLDQGTDASGHDHFHSERVWAVARRLAAETPGVDLAVVELAALLHDVDDWKRLPPGADKSAKTAAWLDGAGIPSGIAEKILDVIRQVSFKSVDQARPGSIEGRLVQDADRLDALGAIGLARLFAFGGSLGRSIHIPTEAPVLGMDADAYQAHRGTSVNHIHEKILHLRDLLNTDAARELGDPRHRYVEDFLARLLDEWEGRR